MCHLEMTDRRFCRREVLTSVPPVVATSVAGCIEATESGRHRLLEFSRINIERRTPESYVVQLRVIWSANGKSERWSTFHDVRLLGYTADGEPACNRRLGDIGPRHDNDDQISVTCSKFPAMFTFDAAESPCDEDTELYISVYQPERDNHFWKVERQRRCDEGIPPNVSVQEPNSTPLSAITPTNQTTDTGTNQSE